MTYQFLTVEMVRTAKTNEGFIDQKMFKTAGKYGFDCRIVLTVTLRLFRFCSFNLLCNVFE